MPDFGAIQIPGSNSNGGTTERIEAEREWGLW